MKQVIAIVLLGLGMLAVTIYAAIRAEAQTARPACGDRAVIVERLVTRWGETMAGGGLQSATVVIEVWRSEETGTWTILQSHANGVTCVVASGVAWIKGGAVAEGQNG